MNTICTNAYQIDLFGNAKATIVVIVFNTLRYVTLHYPSCILTITRFVCFSCRLSEIPVLTAFGLIWNVILSLSAGNVSKSSDEKEGAMDGSVIEDKMGLEASATEGLVGSGKSKFFFGSSKATVGSEADSAAKTPKKNTKTSKVLK